MYVLEAAFRFQFGKLWDFVMEGGLKVMADRKTEANYLFVIKG